MLQYSTQSSANSLDNDDLMYSSRLLINTSNAQYRNVLPSTVTYRTLEWSWHCFRELPFEGDFWLVSDEVSYPEIGVTADSIMANYGIIITGRSMCHSIDAIWQGDYI